MKALFVVVLVVGIVVLCVGVAMAQGSGMSDAGTLYAPTVLGVAIRVAAGGGTLAVSALGTAAWFAPIVRAQGRLRRQFPGKLTRVVQRTPGLKRAIKDGLGVDLDVPSYLVFAKTNEGVGFWTTEPLPIVTVPSDRIQSIETGQSVTSRPVPSVIITVRGTDDSPVRLEFVPSRDGWELFPILDLDATRDFADELRRAIVAA